MLVINFLNKNKMRKNNKEKTQEVYYYPIEYEQIDKSIDPTISFCGIILMSEKGIIEYSREDSSSKLKLEDWEGHFKRVKRCALEKKANVAEVCMYHTNCGGVEIMIGFYKDPNHKIPQYFSKKYIQTYKVI